MVVTELEIVKLFNSVQFIKALLLMEVRLLGRFTDIILEPETKLFGKVSTPDPMVTFVIFIFGISPIVEQFLAFHVSSAKLLQPENALSPIEETKMGIVTLVSALQPEKA